MTRKGFPPRDRRTTGELRRDQDNDVDIVVNRENRNTPVTKLAHAPRGIPYRVRGRFRTGTGPRPSYGSGGQMRVKSDNYFDLRRCVPMSREEEHRCAFEYVKTKDPALAERLVLANMRMVVALARHYDRANNDVSDMIQEGNRGLLRAIRTFDPDRGMRFCTYAIHWIRAYMLSFTMNNWRLIKVGTTQAQRKLFFRLRQERDRLEREKGEANPQELASRLRVKESEIVSMLERFAGGEISLDMPVRAQAPSATTVGDLLSDVSAPRPDRCVEEAEFSQVLRSKLKVFEATLQGRDAQIFGQRLLNDEPITLSRLAAKFGVTRERTRQLEQRLKARIRFYLQTELGDDFALPVAARTRPKTIARSIGGSSAGSPELSAVAS